MGVAGGFHFLRADILAAADDDVLEAIDDEQIAVFVEIADVAGAEMAVRGERCGGGGRIVPITADVRGGADRDLAALPDPPVPAVVAEDRELHDRLLRAAGGGGLVRVIGPEVAASDRVGFG